MPSPLDDKTILITGGTGSLGKTLLRRLLHGEMGRPHKVIIFSRDEAKQHEMRVAYRNRSVVGEEVMYHNFDSLVEFRIGDVRNYASLRSAASAAQVVFHTAALKQVPSSEYFPFEAVQTNVVGAENLVRAVREIGSSVELVVGISTDKACKPVNVMGMTKALQERILLCGGLTCRGTRFVCVRYGNVLSSRGSVVPLFVSQIAAGGPVTITDPRMTRFLLTLDDAVDLIFAAVTGAQNGETYVPRVPTALVGDIAAVLIGEQRIETTVTGIRPGEKLDEVLISEEEAHRASIRGNTLVIRSILPELAAVVPTDMPWPGGEYSSASGLMDRSTLRELLEKEAIVGEHDARRRQNALTH